MAEVFRGRHPGLQREVAVKVITGRWATDPRYHDRFVREVQAVARLAHPAVIRVLDFGRLEEGAGRIAQGSPYLVMELADRGSLEDSPPLSFESLRRVLLQLLDALAYAHARDVVHRDIKPANVLLVSQPDGGVHAKLTDFGIAHAVDPDTDMTASSLEETVGTAHYMPPEQVQSEWRNYGPGTDLYALGCMAWEMATGEVPFPGDHMVQIALAHMTEEPPPFVARRKVPEGFEDWLRRLLEKDPRDRFACAADAAFSLSCLPEVDEWSDISSGAFVNPSTEETLVGASVFEDVESSLMSVGAIAEGSGDISQAYDDAYPEEEDEEDVTDSETEVLSLDALAQMTSGIDIDRPPVPATWRRAESDVDEAVLGVGLGLFGLREIPFVDRGTERDVLWKALREVDATSSTRAVVVRGAAGTGKSRLVQWVARRAEEVGAAQTLQAAHATVKGAKHGLEHMLERFFVTWRMESYPEVERRISWAVRRLWADDDSVSEEFLEHTAKGLASIVSEDDGGVALSTEERLVTMTRLLRQIARARPVILWIDDAHFGDEASVLARRLVEQGDTPILVVLTVSDDALRPTSPCADTLRWLAEHGSGRTVQLEPLRRDDQLELVRRAAGLDEETTRRLVGATVGQPLFAVQLIGDWIERDLLESTRHGFVLRAEADLPNDLRGLWKRRIDRLTERLGGDEQRIALELAATLGEDVTSLEWRAACILANIRPHERLVDEMVNQGLAVRFEEGWSFVDSLLVDSIREGARDNGRWRLLNQTCGEALMELNASNLDWVARRCAGHFIDGEAWGEAIAPLVAVVRNCLATGDIPHAREFLHAHGQALEALHPDEEDRRRAQHRLLTGEVLLRGGEPQRAEAKFEQVVAACERNGWHLELARARRGIGEIAADAGRLREALEEYDRAEECLAFVDDRKERAALLEARAWVWKATGENSRARADLEKALDLHREAGDTMRELNVFNQLAYTFLAEGDWSATREVAEMGVELGSQTGNRAAEAGCWTTLGEIARFRGDIEEARRCYANAERLDELCGARHIWVVRSNSALLELAACEWEDARAKLLAVTDNVREVGFDWFFPLLQIGLACCDAATGDWEAFDRRWDEASALIRQGELIERDVAWMAELIGALAEQEGHRQRSRQAYHFAMKHWQKLGEVWRARDCRIRISALSRSG